MSWELLQAVENSWFCGIALSSFNMNIFAVVFFPKT